MEEVVYFDDYGALVLRELKNEAIAEKLGFSDASTFHHCHAYDGLSLRRRRTLAALVDIVFCCAINETVCVRAISGLFFRVDSRLTRIISRFLSKLNCKL